jgi:chromosome segregation ATPase
MSNNWHSYPPESAPDPSLVEHYDKLLTSRLQEAEANFQERFRQCEKGWQQRSREALKRVSALQAELQVLNQKLVQTSIQTPVDINLETQTTELSGSAEPAGHLEEADAAQLLLNLAIPKSHLTLEGKLKDCQSKLAFFEDRVRHLEQQEDGLHKQIASIAANLKDSQAECTRIRADTESDKAQADLISRNALKTISDKLKASQAACARLRVDLASAKEKLNTERTLSPDEMRKKLAFVESSLEEEKALTDSLQAQLTKLESRLTHWEGFGSGLLRRLHEVQDELQVERTARIALQT